MVRFNSTRTYVNHPGEKKSLSDTIMKAGCHTNKILTRYDYWEYIGKNAPLVSIIFGMDSRPASKI